MRKLCKGGVLTKKSGSIDAVNHAHSPHLGYFGDLELLKEFSLLFRDLSQAKQRLQAVTFSMHQARAESLGSDKETYSIQEDLCGCKTS